MFKFINFFSILVFILFFYFTFKYYSSSKNIKNINLNRSNIEKILENKTSKLPILENDTNNVIEFNSSFSGELENEKSRKFWDLLKK